MIKTITGLLLAILLGASAVIAQDAQVRSLTSGQKYKIKGAVVSKDDDSTFVIRDATGADTRVIVAPGSSIKTKSGWLAAETVMPAIRSSVDCIWKPKAVVTGTAASLLQRSVSMKTIIV